MFWAEIWKISEFFIWKFSFLVVKFSVYLNRRIFVMPGNMASLSDLDLYCSHMHQWHLFLCCGTKKKKKNRKILRRCKFQTNCSNDIKQDHAKLFFPLLLSLFLGVKYTTLIVIDVLSTEFVQCVTSLEPGSLASISLLLAALWYFSLILLKTRSDTRSSHQ